MTVYKLTEANGMRHTIKVSSLDRVACDNSILRTLIGNEIQKYDLGTTEEADKVYEALSTLMEKVDVDGNIY